MESVLNFTNESPLPKPRGKPRTRPVKLELVDLKRINAASEEENARLKEELGAQKAVGADVQARLDGNVTSYWELALS